VAEDHHIRLDLADRLQHQLLVDIGVVFAAGRDIGEVEGPGEFRQLAVTADEEHRTLGADLLGEGDQIVDPALQLSFSILSNKQCFHRILP